MKQYLPTALHRLPVWLLLLLLSAPAMAQSTARMRGTVLDETGQPLVGVTVLIDEERGTAAGQSAARGTTSDAKGLFAFDNLRAGGRYTVTASYIGYEKQTTPNFLINAGDNNSLLIRMKPEQRTLNDVVVIGYGAQSKAKVTGVISQVKGQEMNRYAGSSFAQQLAGKAAGVVINDASAQPGSDPQIVIRGIGTLTAGRNPLIVVDGFPLSEGSSLNSINPQDIETIDILKDPASAAIYGSRAANGVVLITTKKGKAEKMTVSLDAYTGFQERADRVEYVDAYQAAQFFTEARDWGYLSKNATNRSISDDRATRLSKGASLRELRLNYLDPYLNNQANLTNTNWLNEVFRKGKISSYNLSFAGGSDKTNYYVGANFFDQQGIVVNSGLKRYSATIKVDSKLSNKVNLGVAINPSYTSQTYFNNGVNDWSSDPVASIYIMYPMFSPYNADGSLAISTQIKANTAEDGALGENAVALAYKIKNKRNFFRTFGNTYLSYQPIEGLTFKTLLGGDLRSSFFDYYNPSDVGAYRTAAPKPAVAQETRDFTTNFLTENTLTYSRQITDHQIDLLAGYTYQQEDYNATSVTGSSIADDNITNIAGASAFTASADRYTWTQVSYLARAQYSFKNKYLFTGTIRRDGSSRFGDDRKWGNFPSITGGWILSNEAFFPSSRLVTFAKLRASWGQSGNNQIGSYSSKALVNGDNYVWGSNLAAGFAATTTANPNLSWETKTATNIGLNLGLGTKFTVSADYYTSVTKDLLLNVPVPEQSGFSSSMQNIGRVQNNGVELELGGANIDLGPVKWGFNANLATNHNKVLALAPGQEQIITGAESNFRTRVGGPIAELYGFNVIGVYKSQEDINNTPHLTGTLVGDYKVQDLNGDGVIDLNDRQGYGTYNPKFTYGFSSNFAYKNFELSFSLVGIQGRTIYDRQIALFDESGEGFSVPSKYYFENRYNPTTNPDGFLGQPNLGNFSSARKLTRDSNLFFKKADYLRMRNIQLAYTLPKSVTSAVRLSGARVYVSANNLFTLTPYRGFNPDATSVGNVLTNGLALGNYPVARSFIIGANITF
ncbi:TonB-linked SusC/RagA family outer membrane protein [Spirosoma oryzae]|uniref:TonB-linked SusC/RagA family outer membrane protein n=1 Tax=Spirosoma oryzae TaxID=1469603 RepID=A0A2T0RLB5_9BACT|nr:TonB-dependent receptor [Spirosoma oryzae]PRY21927.1 TonB-linked SusC/RagA family outer membrane protein [Spirosoma oryzae]